MKKGSKPSPPDKKHRTGDKVNKSLNLKQLAEIFDEWARRYAEDPQSFSEILDSNGKPATDYGERCAVYFEQLAREVA